MKLHLIILASLLHISTGFMVELRGNLTADVCTGTEYTEFRQCALQGAGEDLLLPKLNEAKLDEKAFMIRGEDRRRLPNLCSGCIGPSPRGTYCYTMCGGRRRLSEESTDKPILRRLGNNEGTNNGNKGGTNNNGELEAVFQNGEYSGDERAAKIAAATIDCLRAVSTTHPCLGSADKMVLTVNL